MRKNQDDLLIILKSLAIAPYAPSMSHDHDDDDSAFTDFSDDTVAIPESGAPEADLPLQQTAHLIFLAGMSVGEMIKINKNMVIGRSRDSDIRVGDPGVSKRHVQIIKQNDGQIVAVDLGSRNGTFVNGERISRAALRDGDKIHVGSTTILKFSLADSIEETFQHKMYEAALRDPLTGLYNRRHLTDHLAHEISYAKRHKTVLSVILFDIDHFKRVNDVHGHIVGDAVLRFFSQTLLRCIRKEDLPARYGGEEFAVICRGVPPQKASVVAERVRQVIKKATPLEDRPRLRFTVSAGVAAMPCPDIDDERTLIAAADQALYEAKHQGRNRVVIHPANKR